jgi:hypothetical protein
VRSLTVRRYGVTLVVVPEEPEEPEEPEVSGDDDPVEPDEHAANKSELNTMGTITFRIDIRNPPWNPCLTVLTGTQMVHLICWSLSSPD